MPSPTNTICRCAPHILNTWPHHSDYCTRWRKCDSWEFPQSHAISDKPDLPPRHTHSPNMSALLRLLHTFKKMWHFRISAVWSRLRQIVLAAAHTCGRSGLGRACSSRPAGVCGRGDEGWTEGREWGVLTKACGCDCGFGCVCVCVCVCVYVYVLRLHMCLCLCPCMHLLCLPKNLCVFLSFCLSVGLSVYRFVCLSVCPSVRLSVQLSIYLSVCLSICLSACLSVRVYSVDVHMCMSTNTYRGAKPHGMLYIAGLFLHISDWL